MGSFGSLLLFPRSNLLLISPRRGGTAGWIRLIKNTLDSPSSSPSIPSFVTFTSMRIEPRKIEGSFVESSTSIFASPPLSSIITFHCSPIRPALPVKFPLFFTILADNSIEISKWSFFFLFTRFPTTRRDNRKVKRRVSFRDVSRCSRNSKNGRRQGEGVGGSWPIPSKHRHLYSQLRPVRSNICLYCSVD